jgi:hypothetical protein
MGRSLVTYGLNYGQVGYGVSTVTGSQTCKKIASALQNYRLWLHPSPVTSLYPTHFGCQAVSACTNSSAFQSVLTANGYGSAPTSLPGNINPMNTAAKPSTAKIRCCGTIKSDVAGVDIGVCPSLASVVGILSGCLSLWYTFMSGTIKLIVLCLDRLDAQQVDAAKLDEAPAQGAVWPIVRLANRAAFCRSNERHGQILPV